MSNFKPVVLDLKKADFDVDVYVARLLKEKTLDELVKEEEEMVSSVRRLDSDVHQIVYENYNKFLTATNTVREIQDEFNQLDTEMESLSANMKAISDLIGDLDGALGEKREDILQLGNSYKVVNSLKHIFDLPQVLQAQFDKEDYSEVIRLYQLANESLNRYNDIQTVEKVMKKSAKIYQATEYQLIEQLKSPTSGTDAISQAVDLLLKVGRDRDEVRKLLHESSKSSLMNDLKKLENGHLDVLDLVDKASETFIPNLTLIATTYEKLFEDNCDELFTMLNEQLLMLHTLVQNVFLSSQDPKDCSIVVRALDRYFRKISTCNHVINGLDFHSSTIDLIKLVSQHEINLSLKRIKEELRNSFKEVRQSFVSNECNLSLLSNKIEQTFVHQVKTALANLLLFTASDVTFANLPPDEFRVNFSTAAHESLLIEAFKCLLQLADEYEAGLGELRFVDARVLLVFAVSLQHLANKSALYLLNLCREQFYLTKNVENLTSPSEVIGDVKFGAQKLIRRYTEKTGLIMGETLAKGCAMLSQPSTTPNTVRSAVRRLVDDANVCEKLLVDLFGGETKQKDAKISKISRRQLTTVLDAARDSLWCERIDFHLHVHFNRSSIMSAIVKMVLKIFIETIRMQTYSRFGVEQVQVDCYYLQRGLSGIVSDEVVVNSMLDQALSSALKRCVDPVLVHPSKLAQLCEQNTNRAGSTTSSLGY